MLGPALGIALLAATDSTSASLLTRLFLIVFTAPLTAVGLGWAVRWSLARRSWHDGIAPKGSLPQPYDLAYAAPIAIAALFASV
ncbi:hypothetical protein [Cellulomonas denverensis]|uniref:Uncharacterized protein n=1 Tax=Cellulomonas denverensis TaxID=264297 RepID=A0A7X6KXY3_9CELL|nr:hypothetical protein [Cellulomonas denverensis]NKY24267.1 hypothetical protein [Cellulomonas denverensis]GIG26742.1 hypothetical protein Cde04nite_29860 [Cellulomonas denverensis]